MPKQSGGGDRNSRTGRRAPGNRQVARDQRRARRAAPFDAADVTADPLAGVPVDRLQPKAAPVVPVAEEIEAPIERIVPGGSGLAFASGRTVFVANTAPGDTVRARVDRTRGKVAFASLVEVLEPGPGRIAPPNPAFVACGGADFQHLSYQAQLAVKGEIVRDCLRRLAGIADPPAVTVAPSPAEWAYRSRAEWRHDPALDRFGYVEHGTHRVCDVVEDPMVVPELNVVLADLRERARRGALPEATTEFKVAAGDDGVGVAPALDPTHRAELRRVVGGERYRYDAEAFFQANHAILPALVAEAMRFAPPSDPGLAVDLYCGVGLFTVPIGRRFACVIGVEGHAGSAVFARRNLADAGLADARVDTGGVDRWLEAHARSVGPVSLLVLDPPRAGAGEATVAGILRLNPKRIAYVSCDPATLGRDLRGLLGGGYAIESVAALDLFPQTHHVETVVHLARTG